MATLDFTAIGRDRGASRMLQGLGRDADHAGRKLHGLNTNAGRMGSGFGKVAGGAAAVGTGLLAAAGAAVGYGLKVAAGNEQARISFTTMLGSASKANKLLRDLGAFAAKTPFEFPELQDATKKMLAFGFAQEDIIPQMTKLGDIAAGLGIPIGELSELYGKARVQGRLYMEDVNQLTGRGIPVIQEFAKQFGVNESQVRKLVETGKIGFPQLEKAFDSMTGKSGKFGGLMEKQSKSLSGMLSTLKDTFAMGLAGALEPILPFIKGAVGAITKSVGDMFSWLATHQEVFVQGIVDTGNAVFGLAKPFLYLHGVALTTLADMADGIAEVLEGMDKLALGDQFSGAVTGLRNFSAGARGAGDAINKDLIPKINKAHEEWNKFGADQRTKAALRDANQVIVRAVEDTTESLKTNGKTIDNNTEKGKNNRAALRNLAASQVDYRNKLSNTGAKTKDVDRYTEQARATFIKTARSLGATEKEAQQLADKYGLLDRRINALNSKTIRLTTNYRATAAASFAKFIENVPAGPNRSGFSQLPRGGPSKARSLDSMIGAPASPPVGFAQGGPSLTSIRHSSPGLSNALGDPAKFRDTAFTAGRYISRQSSAWLGKEGTEYVNGLGAAGVPGGLVGSYSAGMAATISRLRAAGARSFTTYPGHHPSAAKARDVTPHNWRIANTARASSGVWYVIYQMRIASKNHGNTWRQYRPSNFNGDWQHRRHVHVAWYDKGGLLKPGWTMAYNGTGRNERVVPAGGGGGNTYNIYATHYSDAQALKQALVDLDKRGGLAVIKR